MNVLEWCDMWLATKDLILVMSRIQEFFNEILPLQDGGAISRIMAEVLQRPSDYENE